MLLSEVYSNIYIVYIIIHSYAAMMRNDQHDSHVHHVHHVMADTHLKLPIYGETSSSIALEGMSKRVPSLDSVNTANIATFPI